MSYCVTRLIAIDAGHRIRQHGSKCRHLHGHRYTVEATCRAEHLHEAGEQSGMVLDFGFLKEEMLAVIDEPCDHGFIAEMADTELLALFCPPDRDRDAWLEALRRRVAADGYALTTDTALGTRLCVIADPPTAEGLARHWYHRLKDRVHARSDGYARLDRVRVWETPNCWAEYEE